jgi:hypothetical protein
MGKFAEIELNEYTSFLLQYAFKEDQAQVTFWQIKNVVHTFLPDHWTYWTESSLQPEVDGDFTFDFFKYSPGPNDDEKLVFFRALKFGSWIYMKIDEMFQLTKSLLRKITGMICAREYEDQTKTALQTHYDDWLSPNIPTLVTFETYLNEYVQELPWQTWLRENVKECEDALEQDKWDPNSSNTDKDVLLAEDQQNPTSMQELFEFGKTHPQAAEQTVQTLDVDLLACSLKQALQAAELQNNTNNSPSQQQAEQFSIEQLIATLTDTSNAFQTDFGLD